jgi:hypothetical protein
VLRLEGHAEARDLEFEIDYQLSRLWTSGSG